MITANQVLDCCRIKVEDFEKFNPHVPYRIVKDSAEMGVMMARELVDEVIKNNEAGKSTRAIIPCGPSCWYEPLAKIVNGENVSLKNLVVFHMDECLDREGNLLPADNPYNFRTTMERVFYNPVRRELAVPEKNRFWLTPYSINSVREEIWREPIDITLGGWGQDGHIAYNQARREPYSQASIEEVANSSIRVQNNNWDTVIALSQRVLGTAYQLAPPMSVTLGVKECLSAAKVRLFSDTGSWKQTAFRVALFGPLTPEYPITLTRRHPDACLIATYETADHPISRNTDWRFF